MYKLAAAGFQQPGFSKPDPQEIWVRSLEAGGC
jgi:hypothetical protein